MFMLICALYICIDTHVYTYMHIYTYTQITCMVVSVCTEVGLYV